MATIYLTTSAKVDGNGYTQVLLRLSGGTGVTPRAKSGVRIKAEFWNAKKQRLNVPRIAGATQREAMTAQRILDELCARIYEAFANLPDRAMATSQWLAGIVDEYHHPRVAARSEIDDALDIFLRSKGYSRSRYYSFRQVVKSLARWAIVRGLPFEFDTLDQRAMADFEAFLRDEHLYATNGSFAHLYADERGAKTMRSGNTVASLLTRLRTFLRWSVSQGYATNNPFERFKVKEEVYGTPYYLTIEERRALAEATMPTDALAVIRDIFVFQCCVGCRVGDLAKLTKSNVIGGALEYVPRKTKDGHPITVRVVLNATATAIINKYSDRDDERLLPFVADAYYNRGIKEAFAVAGLSRMVTTLDPKSREEVQRPLCEVASSHLARRTFIGNLYRQVKDPNLIASMTGHKEGSRAFSRYRAIDDGIKAEVVALLD